MRGRWFFTEEPPPRGGTTRGLAHLEDAVRRLIQVQLAIEVKERWSDRASLRHDDGPVGGHASEENPVNMADVLGEFGWLGPVRRPFNTQDAERHRGVVGKLSSEHVTGGLGQS